MRIKRLIAAAVSLVMLWAVFCVPSVASGAAASKCGCGEVLQVWVDGFGQALYYDEGGPDEREAGNIHTDGILPSLQWVALGGALSLRYQSWLPLAGGLGQVLYALLGHLRVDEHGKSVEPIGSHWVIDEEQVKNHRDTPEFWFRYDFRMDPFELAAQLNDFIETLCKKTGHDRIAITGHSEGTNIVMTYVSVYGTRRLETIILANGGWQGLTLAGQLFTGELALDPRAIANLIADLDDGSGTTRAAAELLYASHLLDFTPTLGEFLANNLVGPLFQTTLVPLMCTMPVVWAFVPPEHYEQAIKVLGDDPKYDEVRARADRYQREVMAKSPALLKKAKANGVKVAVIASYQWAPIPVTKDSFYQSDRLIESARAAGGATAAPFGQVLPPSDSKYRSPDGVFDAATCVLPDQTWFVKYNWHNPDCMEDLRQWVIHSRSYPSVTANPDFPQYLMRTEDGRAVPLTEGERVQASLNFAQAAWGVAKALFN